MLALLLMLTTANAAEQTSDDAKALLAGAIDRGAPLYNQGSPQGCAAVYEVAAVALVRFGADELSDRDLQLLETTLRTLPASPDQQAWALRRSFDAVLQDSPIAEASKRLPAPDATGTTPRRSLPINGAWREVDDRVMGGISRGSVTVDGDGHVIWTGRMTTESNGGFVTARTAFPPLDLSRAAGLVFRVRGDGRTYKVPLNTTASHGRGIGMAQLPTRAGEWVEVTVPFADFNGPMYGGTRPLDPTRVQSLQFQLSGAEQVGTYRLEIASVEGFVD